MSSPERFTIRLLAPLIPNGIEPGTMFAVEYDPASQWFAVAATVVVQYLQDVGRVTFQAFVRPRDALKRDLVKLGVDVPKAIKDGQLIMDDWYSAAQAGGRVNSGSTKDVSEWIEGGCVRLNSLKVADLSISWLKNMKSDEDSSGIPEFDNANTVQRPPGSLIVVESLSVLLRFNEEKPFLEWQETRVLPNERAANRINLAGYARGLHSESFYKRIEEMHDGLIEVRLMEKDGDVGSYLRVTNLRGQPHDSRWRRIEVKSNGEATLTT